jgi:hypothetical protein
MIQYFIQVKSANLTNPVVYWLQVTDDRAISKFEFPNVVCLWKVKMKNI